MHRLISALTLSVVLSGIGETSYAAPFRYDFQFTTSASLSSTGQDGEVRGYFTLPESLNGEVNGSADAQQIESLVVTSDTTGTGFAPIGVNLFTYQDPNIGLQGFQLVSYNSFVVSPTGFSGQLTYAASDGNVVGGSAPALTLGIFPGDPRVGSIVWNPDMQQNLGNRKTATGSLVEGDTISITPHVPDDSSRHDFVFTTSASLGSTGQDGEVRGYFTLPASANGTINDLQSAQAINSLVVTSDTTGSGFAPIGVNLLTYQDPSIGLQGFQLLSYNSFLLSDDSFSGQLAFAASNGTVVGGSAPSLTFGVAPGDSRVGIITWNPDMQQDLGNRRTAAGSLLNGDTISIGQAGATAASSILGVGDPAPTPLLGFDPGTSSGPAGAAAADFGEVTTPGTLTVSYTTDGEPAANVPGFSVAGSELQAWEVDFDGTFSGQVELTFVYDESLLGGIDEATLAIAHLTQSGVEILIPFERNLTLNWVKIHTSSFSPFELVVQSNAAAVPEPATLALSLLGLCAGFAVRHARRKCWKR